MKSPFPGMDPYLELNWRDVHQSLAVYARDQLQAKLPGGLIARVEEQIYVEPREREVRARIIYPDVRVAEHSGHATGEGGVAVASEVAEPLVVYLPERTTEGYVEVREANADQRLITVIEILSPSNKSAPKGRTLYRQQQDELLDAGVNLVEIDLLRGGDWVMSVPEEDVPTAYRAMYRACVRRSWTLHQAEIYQFSLRQALPSIKIPLRETDKDVPLDLQSLIDRCYTNGRYESIDYSVDLAPPFDEADAAWISKLLKSAGKR